MLIFSTLIVAAAGLLVIHHKYDKMTKLIEQNAYELESRSHMIGNLNLENHHLINKFNKLQEKTDKLTMANYVNSLKTEIFYNTQSNEIVDSSELVKLGVL
jgi:hypothetical protein